jgi:hypothetical protein
VRPSVRAVFILSSAPTHGCSMLYRRLGLRRAFHAARTLR